MSGALSLIEQQRRLRVESVIAGGMIGVFQLVGRSQLGQIVGGETTWFLELRLWVLAVLSLWLTGIVAASESRAREFYGGNVRVWGGMIVCFLAYMIITSLWAPDLTLAIVKSYDLLFVAWSCALTVAALRVCGVRATIQGFWWAIFGLGLVLATAGVAAALAGNLRSGRVTVLGGGPNVFGRNMGLLTLASLRFMFDNRPWVRRAALIAAPAAALLVLQSGSRGAILALFAGLIVYLGVRRIDRRVVWSIVLVGMVGVVALATRLGALAVSIFTDRFIRLLLIQGYTTNRTVLIVDGIGAGLQNPVGGMGLAGFVQLPSPGTYPHNMFVEAFAEGGSIGFVLLCIPFVAYALRWRRGMGLGDAATVGALSLLIVSSSISGDLFDARGVFLLLLMAVASQIPTDRVRPQELISA